MGDITGKRPEADDQAWDEGVCRDLIGQLWALRRAMLANESRLAERIAAAAPPFRESARNLAHYLAFRRQDRRPLQERLAWIGVSSLGRAESHVLANVDKVLGILHRLVGEPWLARGAEEPAGIQASRLLLETHTASLLGEVPPGREVRIMVTLPSEAAADYGMVHDLVAAGMDVARINCAHDSPEHWARMAAHVRRAAESAGRSVRVAMDLGGPKLRTGAVPPGPVVLKLHPERDELGHVVAPDRIGLRPAGSDSRIPGARVHAGVEAAWLERLQPGDHIDFEDGRGAERSLLIVSRCEAGVLAECARTAYLLPATRLKRRRKHGGARTSRLCDLPARPGSILLERGDLLRLTRAEAPPGRPQQWGQRWHSAPKTLACTLPEVFGQVRVGERVWLDDGRIGGIIRGVASDRMDIEITRADTGGSRLAADKGINLPDSRLDLPALTDRDIADLASAAALADMVGLSFVQHGDDVLALRRHLGALGKPELGIILKIETRRGFENLPDIVFAAMAGSAAGIMIARGDLAVECGYERLAEVQEEILWAAEAAHLPVVWATQVLETLARKGQPSRAEITDAAMGERAECVMLNKGPHILQAIRTLDDILRRMQSHQSKKRPLLRALSSWNPADPEES